MPNVAVKYNACNIQLLISELTLTSPVTVALENGDMFKTLKLLVDLGPWDAPVLLAHAERYKALELFAYSLILRYLHRKKSYSFQEPSSNMCSI